jgi:hypothetical protein
MRVSAVAYVLHPQLRRRAILRSANAELPLRRNEMARRSRDALARRAPDFGALIAERAYFRAEKRGFAPGHELEDWLEAEREIAELRAIGRPKKSAGPSVEPPVISAAPKKPAARRKASAAAKKLK